MPSERDLDDLAWTMLGEAGGEGEGGMADVGHVILNRLENGRYGNSISEVARANKQFSTWNEGEGGNNPQGRYPKTSPEFKKARELAEQVVSGTIPGPPGKPLDYHTPDISPYWAESKNKFGTYERNGHLFYASVPTPPGELPQVGTAQSTTRGPVTGSPTPLPPMLAAQRNLQPTTQDTASLYRGIFAEPPLAAPRVPSAPITDRNLIFDRGISDTIQNSQTQQNPDLAAALAAYVAPKAPARQMRQPSASERSALAYVAPPAPRIPPRQPNAQERTALAYVAPPRVSPATNGRDLQRAEQTQRNLPRITTVASIPTIPTTARLPRLPASSVASPRVISTTMDRAAAAQDPVLAAALAPRAPTAPRQPSAAERSALAYVAPKPAARTPTPPRQPSASERAALSFVPPKPAVASTGIGSPPATRVVQSVPVKPPAKPPAQIRQPTASERAALAYVPPKITAPKVTPVMQQPNAAQRAALAYVPPKVSVPSVAPTPPRITAPQVTLAAQLPRVPGPSAPPKIGEERLVAGQWGVPSITGAPQLPGQSRAVGTQLSVMPPLPRARPVVKPVQTASVPLPRPRPAQAATPARAVASLPQRQVAAPLNVLVQGAKTQALPRVVQGNAGQAVAPKPAFTQYANVPGPTPGAASLTGGSSGLSLAPGQEHLYPSWYGPNWRETQPHLL